MGRPRTLPALVLLLLARSAAATDANVAHQEEPVPAAPHIPEPMVFDLVRGLGAAPGELESNVLALAHRGGKLTWAPEVEWAFAQGHAVEVELPLVGRRLEAIKLALQGTLPGGTHTAHGWQASAEVALDNAALRAMGLYIVGHRVNPLFSALVMVGGRVDALHDQPPAGGLVVNPSVFMQLPRGHVLGVETNVDFTLGGIERFSAFPQAHLQLAPMLRLLLCVGVEVVGGEPGPVGGIRLVQES